MSRAISAPGVASVRAKVRLSAGERIASARNTRGGFAIGWVAGAISASAPTQSGMIERKHEGERTAERMADDHRPVEPEPLDGQGERRGLRRKARRTPGARVE